jgi:S-adenosylmethionine hydrolase
MIVLFTDFGMSGPYLGQMKAVLYRAAPEVPLIDLFADAPAHSIRNNAYLLAAYSAGFPEGTVFLAVVDPGVGSESRKPVVVNCDGRWFVGPGNGLFDIVIKRATCSEQWQIQWRPEQLSASFHGRDLFAPVAAMLATGQQPAMQPLPIDQSYITQLPDELAQIIYIDHFGNLLTGVRAVTVADDASLHYRGVNIPRVKTFADLPVGQPLCYENSNGLLEIAVNQGRADGQLSASIGDSVTVITPDL